MTEIIDESYISSVIERELPDFYDDGRKQLLYIYMIILDGKACIKPGITSKKLSGRIYQYLSREHSKQLKIKESFHMISIFEGSPRTIKKLEELIKENLVKFPLNIGQHHLTEQYVLYDGYTSLYNNSKGFTHFPFCDEVYFNEKSIDQAKELFKMEKQHVVNPEDTKENYATIRSPERKSRRVVYEDTKSCDDGKMLEKINRMHKHDLMKIDGIGNVLANRILEKRLSMRNGKFTALEQIVVNQLPLNGARYKKIIEYLQ